MINYVHDSCTEAEGSELSKIRVPNRKLKTGWSVGSAGKEDKSLTLLLAEMSIELHRGLMRACTSASSLVAQTRLKDPLDQHSSENPRKILWTDSRDRVRLPEWRR